MEAPYIILLSIVAFGALLWLWHYVSSEFGRIAEEKGFSAQHYRRMCFWLGLLGIMMVIALPDRKGSAVSSQHVPVNESAPAGSQTPAEAVRTRNEQAADLIGSAARSLKATASAVMADAAQKKPFIPAKQTDADSGSSWQCTCRAQNPIGSSICNDCRSTWRCACGKVNPRTESRCTSCKAWYCTCGKVNPASRGSCDLCGAAKPSDAIVHKPQRPLPASDSAPVSAGTWRCSCGETVEPAQWRCPFCRAWRCACGAVNPVSKGMCEICSKARPR